MEIRQVQIRFTETDAKYGSYSDALYFPLEGFEEIKQEDIDAEKQMRLANWKDAIENPVVPEPVEKTKEDLESEKVAILASITELQAKIIEVDSKIAVKEAEEKEVVIKGQ